MAYLRVALFASIGILVALCVLPSTRWVVENDLQFLGGKTPADDYYGCRNPKTWPTRTQEQQLAYAINIETLNRNGELGPRLGPLEAYCNKYPDDAAGWAHLLRLAMQVPLRPRGVPEPRGMKPADVERRRRAMSLMAMAIANGKRLEPNNTYFSMLEVAYLESLDRHEEAQKALQAASAETDFKDYTWDEGKLEVRVAEQTCGYRGTAMEVGIYAGIQFPHVASLRPVFPGVVFDTTGPPIPERQLQAIRLVHTVAKKSDSSIDVLVMKSVFNRCLLGTPPAGTPAAKLNAAPEALRLAAAALDRRMNTHEAEQIESDFEKVDFRRIEASNEGSQSIYDQSTSGPIWSASVIAGIILCAPAVFLVWFVSFLKLRLSRTQERIVAKPWVWYFCAATASLSVIGIVVALYWRHPGANYSYLAFPDSEGSNTHHDLGLVIGWLSAAVFAIALALAPRCKGRVLTVLAPLLFFLAVAYLGMVLHAVRLDESMKEAFAGLGSEVDIVRGQW